MKTCPFCKRRARSRAFATAPDSPNHGEWCGNVIPDGKNDGPDYIELIGDNRIYALHNISFCPICGRDLSTQPIRNTEQDYSTIIRNNIKELISKEAYSLTRLAAESGIAKSTLSDYLNGKIDNLTASKIAVIADVLDVPIERLFLPDREV